MLFERIKFCLKQINLFYNRLKNNIAANYAGITKKWLITNINNLIYRIIGPPVKMALLLM